MAKEDDKDATERVAEFARWRAEQRAVDAADASPCGNVIAGWTPWIPRVPVMTFIVMSSGRLGERLSKPPPSEKARRQAAYVRRRYATDPVFRARQQSWNRAAAARAAKAKALDP
jgi:hypothetical protein